MAPGLVNATLDDFGKLTSALVDLTVLVAAIVAVVKFRLYNVMSRRWQSDLKCAHTEGAKGEVVFWADYTVANNGQRPLRINKVTLRMTGARSEDAVLWPDDSRVIAQREFPGTEPGLAGNLDIQPGERSIFTLRCRLPALDDAVFVVCLLELPYRRVPAVFRGFYATGAAAAAKA